jgi:predicted permease
MKLLDDIRYALRQFKNAPGFTATAVLTLALGIGATTAIFTLIQEVLLKSLPVARPEELWRVGNEEICCMQRGLQGSWALFSFRQYQLFAENTSGFAGLAAFQAGESLIGVRRAGDNRPSEPFSGEYVSGNYFSTFGINAYAGRMLSPQDDAKGAPLVAVMSFRAWQEKFGKDPSVVGAVFDMDTQPVVVVGIAPPQFFGDRIRSEPPGLWIPLEAEPIIEPTYSLLNEPSWSWLDLVGRVPPNGDIKAIETQMQVELQGFLRGPESKVEESEKPLLAQQTLRLWHGGGGGQALRREYQNGLYLLMSISAFVLLIACANLANLMLVRATARKRQTLVRVALGAAPSTLVRLALAESLVLAAIGCIAGMLVAFAVTRTILVLAFGNDYVPIRATPSLPVFAFAFGVSLLTEILFGVTPLAWFSTRVDPAEALRGANRLIGQSSDWGQKSLVVAQVALSFTLLCAAGLLVRSLRDMRYQEFGFDTTNRYILHIDPKIADYKPDQLETLYRQLRDSVGRIPGIERTSFSLYSPMEGSTWYENVFIEGEPPPPPDTTEAVASWVRVGPGYFDVIGTRVVKGRDFNEQDTPRTRVVALVNRSFERKYFKDGAIGKHFGDRKEHPGAFEIVGVTEDTNYWGPSSPIYPMYFLAQGQSIHSDDPLYRRFEDSSQYLTAIEIRTGGKVPGLDVRLREAVAQTNPDLAILDFLSFAAQVETNLTQQAMIAKLTSFFGLLALVLASIGLYGVTAYSVERRTSEIGLRMALGANRGQVFRLVLRNAFVQVGIGFAIGIPVTIFSGRVMANQLFGVTSHDPVLLSVTTVALSIVAFLATIVPALRATKTEPTLALKIE